MHVLAQVPVTDPIVAIGGFVGLTALILKAVDFLRLLANLVTNKSAVITQLLAWIGGIGAVVLFAATDFGDSVNVAGTTLDKVSGVTLVLLGIMLSSAASVLVDFKQSIDSTDSAAKPPLLK
jgi:hypothetical protein